MTPERREYLHSISKEELYVRFALSTVRSKLSIAKLNKSLGYLGETDTEIQDYKTIIKVLKKELPQEPIYHDWGIRYCYYCPTCHFIINHYENRCKDGCCCSACGQKLR